MAITLHRLYQSVINGVGTMPGIRQRNSDPKPELFRNRSSGDIYNSFVALQRQEPMVTWTTTDIETAIGTIGLDGLAISNAAGVVLWYAQQDESGVNQSGANHTKKTARTGAIYLTEISAKGDSEAEVNITFQATKDTTNDIWVVATGQSLPSQVLITEKFKHAKFVVNGSALDGEQSVTLNFNNKHETHKQAGEVWPRKCFVSGIAPSIEIETSNVADWTTFGIDGIPVTSWIWWLRALDNDDVEYADASTEHIKIYGNEGIIYPTKITDAHGRVVGSGLHLEPRLGNGDPVLFAVNQAIA